MQIFTTSTSKGNRPKKFKSSLIFWYTLSIIFSIAYVAMGLRLSYGNQYVVSDDGREYLSWMYRYSNPSLFPGDLIADYFQSVTPIGFGWVYKIIAALGIDIIFFSKVLPIVLALVTTSYCFAVSMRLLAVPITGFIACLLLNQSLGLHDDLFSATPRDFIYPLFLAFLYYLLRGSWVGIFISIALQALIYPLIAFVDLMILFLGLFSWQNRKLQFGDEFKQKFLLFAISTIIAGVAILPYALQSSQFGPTITAAVARTMPEYWPGGRVSYFSDNPIYYWLDGRDSGFFALIAPPQIMIGLLLPVIFKYSRRFPLTKQINPQIKLLLRVVIACLIMYSIAHIVAFKLHWPSRYTNHAFKIILALATGITLTVFLDAAMRWSKQAKKQLLTLGIIAAIGAALIFYPSSLKNFPKTPYVGTSVPSLHNFLQQQPENILIASTSKEADNIPAFARRSILVGREYGLPFHTKYYAQFKTRVNDLLTAQYSLNLDQVKDFIQKYNVTFWLLERSAFTPEYLTKNKWLQQYKPAVNTSLANLKKTTPALAKSIKLCTILEAENIILVDTKCIQNS